MNKREEGARRERQAALYLLHHKHYRLLSQNYRCHLGEIDLIAMDGPVLVFVEVKYRSSDSFGIGEQHVNKRKQQRIFRVAQQYLCRYYPNGHYPPCRFDVIALDASGRIHHISGAFEK